jgi:hypothetical protein
MSFHDHPGRLRNPPVEIEPRLAEVERVLKRRR